MRKNTGPQCYLVSQRKDGEDSNEDTSIHYIYPLILQSALRLTLHFIRLIFVS